MSNWIRNFGAARESAFFKVEQEADLQRHRKRLLLGDGRIEAIAGACLGPKRAKSFEESVRAFEVLPEVLQQQARIDDPDAAHRKEVVKRIRSAPPELTELERLQYRSAVYGLAAAINVPQARLGRDRFAMAAQAGAQAAEQRPLTPLAQAAESGRFLAAARSLAYGSAAGLAGAALLGALAWRYLGSHESQEGASWKEDWREQLLAAGRPWADSWQQRLGIQNTLEAEGLPSDPGAKLGVTGQAFVKQLSMRLRATMGLPTIKPVPPREAAQLELGLNPALNQTQHAIQHPEHVANG